MAQKLIGLDDAAKHLGVPTERLNALREAGQLRAYRDGASWKFRSDEIDGLKANGLPPLGGSGIGGEPATLEEDSLDFGAVDSGDALLDDGDDGFTIDDLELDDLAISSDVGVDESDESEESDEKAAASDLDLAPIDEPTVAASEAAPAEDLTTGGLSDDALGASADEDLVLDAEASGDDAESILLSEAELGGTVGRPPSTIIGRHELATDEDDLEVVDELASMSDVRLADAAAKQSSPAEPAAEEPSAQPPAGKFEDLEQLEIDLEAESSRILEAEDLEAARAAREQAEAAKQATAGDSDLQLAPSDSDAGFASLAEPNQPGDAEGTGLSLADDEPLELELDDASGSGSQLSGLSGVELAADEDDDFVLGDSGSDITASAADSGINLAPADSGIAIGDASQILGESAVGSSFDLSGIGSSVVGGSQAMQSAELSSSEDFLLTPVGAADDDDEEDSSQIIAV
ncbi:MAG: helix-turn-helix domain-containing protein, partial [Planctomycetota bacterium]